MQISTAEPPKVYVETSVWGMILPDQPRALRQPTKRFLDQCRARSIAPFISTLVLEEIFRAESREARRMLAAIDRVDPVVLMSTSEADNLAEDYIRMGVLPAKKRDDGRHVAIATTQGLDILVSWNHRHLANDRKKELFNAVNRLAGREKILLIHTPLEVLK